VWRSISVCVCVCLCVESVYQLLMELSSSMATRLEGSSRGGVEAECGEVSVSVCVSVCLCVESLYQLLMELSSSMATRLEGSSRGGVEAECGSVSAVACACLLSLVIGRGDTGKLLTAIVAMLMYSQRLAVQHITVRTHSVLLLWS